MRRNDHAALIEREARFPAGHREGYEGYLRYLKELREDHYDSFLRSRARHFAEVNEVIAAFDDAPPEEFAAPYDLTPEAIEELSGLVQRKYVMRFKNIRRSWSLLLQYLPELMAENAAPRDVLELSSAHGATLEILRHKGHRVVGNDFPNFLSRRNTLHSGERRVNTFDRGIHRDDHGFIDEEGEILGWPYQRIIESLGLDVRLFDCGQIPYPLEDRSFDTLITFDALEHYCRPEDWMSLVDEFTRIARRSILIVTNAVQEHKLQDGPYMDAFYAFQKGMRNYRKGGFECLYAGLHRHQLTVFKLVRTQG